MPSDEAATITCVFTRKELEALYTYLFCDYVAPAQMPAWESARAEIKRKLKPNDPTIGGSKSWP